MQTADLELFITEYCQEIQWNSFLHTWFLCLSISFGTGNLINSFFISYETKMVYKDQEINIGEVMCSPWLDQHLLIQKYTSLKSVPQMHEYQYSNRNWLNQKCWLFWVQHNNEIQLVLRICCVVLNNRLPENI